MSTFYRWPCPDRGEFARKFGGIVEALRNYSRHLPDLGWHEVHTENEADLVTGHLGTQSKRLDVFHCHGLYPTGEPQFASRNFQGNRGVIENLRRARSVVCVSDWVADILRRDMHLRPYVLGHGFDFEAWQDVPKGEVSAQPFALWNKTRAVGVCDPSPVLELARRFSTFGFVTTFMPKSYSGPAPENVQVTGLVEHETAWQIVRDCTIYLATTKETFGISTLEAMASGAAIVGYRWGATPDVLGNAGILVDPGDIAALAGAFQEALDRRAELGERAMRRVATRFRWADVIARLGAIYDEVLGETRIQRPKVTVVIPVYNYARHVDKAILSVLCQTSKDWELIIVDDASTDNSADVAEAAIKDVPNARLIRQPRNLGVAAARNRGIAAGSGEYIVCVDADDAMEPGYLEIVTPAMDADRSLGIGYTGICAIDDQDRRLGVSEWPRQFRADEWAGHNQIPTLCMYRRDLWERAGGYRPRHCPHGAGQEDADLWLRMLTLGGAARQVTPDPLFLYRMHDEQATRRTPEFWRKRRYLDWHPYIPDGQFPLASQIGVPKHGTWPVRNYDRPQVSVIIPVGPNHADTLIDAIDSVEAQTERHWELIVVNDSGQMLNLQSWPYIRYLETPGGKGAGYARNRGTEIARAPTITYLDADDILQPTYLADCLDAWKKEGGRWVYTDLFILHPDSKIELYEVEDWNVRKLWRSGLCAVTALYSRDMWATVGGFDEQLAGREDWDFHLRLAQAGFCGVHLPEAGFTYRHATGLRRVEGQFRQEIEILHAKYPEDMLMAKCGSCGGRGRARRPRSFAQKQDTGFVPMEYVGPNIAGRTYRGRSGRIYRIDSKRNRKFMAHSSDVAKFLRLGVFRRVDQSKMGGPEATLQADARPKGGSIVTRLPTGQETGQAQAKAPVEKEAPAAKGDGLPDPSALTVAAIQALDLSPIQWSILLQREQAGKGRKTALAFLEEMAHGQSKSSNVAIA